MAVGEGHGGHGEGHGGHGTALCPFSINGVLGMVCAGMRAPQRNEGLQTLPKTPGCSGLQDWGGCGVQNWGVQGWGCWAVGYRTGGVQDWGDAGLGELGAAGLWGWGLRDCGGCEIGGAAGLDGL